MNELMRKIPFFILGGAFLALTVVALAEEISPTAKNEPEANAAPQFFSPVDTKEAVRAAFQKGKKFYDQGKYAEAFTEWDTVDSSLEDSSIKKTIEFLKSRVKSVAVKPAPAISPISAEPIQEPPPAASAQESPL